MCTVSLELVAHLGTPNFHQVQTDKYWHLKSSEQANKQNHIPFGSDLRSCPYRLV